MALGHIQSCCKWSWLTSTSWQHHFGTFPSNSTTGSLLWVQGIYLQVVPCNSLQTCSPPAGNSLISTLWRNMADGNAGFHLRIFLLHVRTISYKRSEHILPSHLVFQAGTWPPPLTHQLCSFCVSLGGPMNNSSEKWKNAVFRSSKIPVFICLLPLLLILPKQRNHYGLPR